MSPRLLRLACALVLALQPCASASARDFLEYGGSRSCIVGLGDLDHDGFPDFALARRELEHPGLGRQRVQRALDRVWIVSGRYGTAIRTLMPGRLALNYGNLLANAGDLDHDGCADLVVGGIGSLWVHSSRTGALLHELSGALLNSAFTGSIATGHDVDCDGVPDIAGHLEPGGVVALHSGRTGELLRLFGTPARPSDWRWSAQDWIDAVGATRFVLVDADRLGGAVAFCADRHRIGGAALALAIQGAKLPIEPGQSSHPANDRVPQGVAVVDALDGQRLMQFWNPPLRSTRPWLLTDLPDIDADGVDELALTIVSTFLAIHSGATGAELRVSDWRGFYMNGEGSSMAAIDDVNGDGVCDHLIGANEDDDDCDDGFASLNCGRTGESLGFLDLRHADMQAHGRPSGCGPGADVCALGDFDGDDVPDALVAIPRLDQLRVLSGRGFAELRRYSMSAIMSEGIEAKSAEPVQQNAAPGTSGSQSPPKH